MTKMTQVPQHIANAVATASARVGIQRSINALEYQKFLLENEISGLKHTLAVLDAAADHSMIPDRSEEKKEAV